MTDRETPKLRAKPRQLAASARSEDADTQIVQSLARGLDILAAFRRSDAALGNTELAERTGMTKPTVSRLTYTLAERGFLHFDPRSRLYRLGVKTIALGVVALANTSVPDHARPLMRALARSSHFNIGLGMRDGRRMTYVEACEGDSMVTLRLFAGSHVPLATSAMGRAYLAALPAAEREAVVAELRPSHEQDWPAIARGIEQACEDLTARGFCMSLREWHRDIHAVAVPVRTLPGQPRFVVNLGGPAYALDEATIIGTLGPQLVAMVRDLESSLGL